jgi:hypothetical protein
MLEDCHWRNWSNERFCTTDAVSKETFHHSASLAVLERDSWAQGRNVSVSSGTPVGRPTE